MKPTTSKKRLLRSSRLYLVLDAGVNPYRKLLDILRQSAGRGVDIVQLRDKKGTARDILAFSRLARKIIRGRIPYIINDRVDLARLAADGVHLGQEDVPIVAAKKILGSSAIIGVSCQTLHAARQAQTQGADYIGFGSVFKTLTKPRRRPQDLSALKKVAKHIRIPVFAIGGITRSSAGRVQEAGIYRMAVCRDICLARDIARVVAEWKILLNRDI